MNATTSPTLFENSGSGATNLMTTVVPAGTLVNAGDSFEIEAVFTLPTAAAGKVITLQFGGTTIITVTTSQNGGSLIFRARVVRLTANTQIFYGTSQLSGGTASGNYTTGAINLAVSQSVICIGTGSNSGDIIQQVQMVRAATL